MSPVVNHFWAPIIEITDYINSLCLNFKNVLEIGPGVVPFKSATEFIGYNEKINYIKIDIDNTKFPFTKEFDFIYCRHVLEDIQNPDFAFSEILRTGKSGYIETPSPLVEITKGVEDPNYAGYIHHRYIIWSYLNTIYFLPKYPIIEHFTVNENFNKILNERPVYWNNYFLWNKESKFVVYKNGVNMEIRDDYVNLINRAISESIANTESFMSNV